MPITPTSFMLELLYDFTDHPQVSRTPHLWGEPAEVVLEKEDAFIVVDGDNFTLNCASSVYNNTHHPVWCMQNSTAHNCTGCLLVILFYSALLSVIVF
jgi:hypothetical protein